MPSDFLAASAASASRADCSANATATPTAAASRARAARVRVLFTGFIDTFGDSWDAEGGGKMPDDAASFQFVPRERGKPPQVVVTYLTRAADGGVGRDASR